MELVRVEFYWEENGITYYDYLIGFSEEECVADWREEFPERKFTHYIVYVYGNINDIDDLTLLEEDPWE